MHFTKPPCASYRHAFARDYFPRKRLDYLVVGRSHSNLVTVKVVDGLLKSEEGLLQLDVEVYVKIVANTPENSVLFLLNDESDVSLDSVDMLLALVLKHFLVPSLHARLNFYYEGF